MFDIQNKALPACMCKMMARVRPSAGTSEKKKKRKKKQQQKTQSSENGSKIRASYSEAQSKHTLQHLISLEVSRQYIQAQGLCPLSLKDKQSAHNSN
jgi:hypothetical protein